MSRFAAPRWRSRAAALPAAFLGVLLLALAACGPDRSEALAQDALTRGNDALAALEFDAAVEHYTAALEQDPDLAGAYLGRAQVRWMGRQHARALADLDRALALDPDLGWAHFLRGSSLFALDSVDAALPALARAGAAADLAAQDRARAHRMRAIVFMNTERYGDGVDALDAAIALQPDHAFHYYERGLLHATVGREAEAAADLERYLGMVGDQDDASAQQARRTLDTLRAGG